MTAARNFEATPATRSEEPLLLGIVGPPGGGKTLSSLRLAKGIQSVRGGPIIVIDTEGGRSRKYADVIPFDCHEFQPPCRPEDFLTAIKQQILRKPACVIVDSMSDEHEGEGGYLEWHDEMIPKMGNNEWAAWAKPKASRKKLISGILHIKTPLIFTFRAREKTKQQPKAGGGKMEVVNIGWQPVAPLEIVHTLDLTCILPPRADGVPVWKSDKVGEDFIIKLPQYLQPYIKDGEPLSEAMGAGFATWAKGGTASAPTKGSPAQETPAASDIAEHSDGHAAGPDWQEYAERWNAILEEAVDPKELGALWNSPTHKTTRGEIQWPAGALQALMTRVTNKIADLKRWPPTSSYFSPSS